MNDPKSEGQLSALVPLFFLIWAVGSWMCWACSDWSAWQICYTGFGFSVVVMLTGLGKS